MPSKRIEYSLKPAVVINFGDSHKEFHSGCSVIDLVFPKAPYIEVKCYTPFYIVMYLVFTQLMFRNYGNTLKLSKFNFRFIR